MSKQHSSNALQLQHDTALHGADGVWTGFEANALWTGFEASAVWSCTAASKLG